MTAAVLVALAVLITGPRPARRVRPRTAAGAAGARPLRRRTDPHAVAAALDLLAVCLSAGLPVSAAATAAAGGAPEKLARPLRRAADLLALGADPGSAWTRQAADPADAHLDALLRMARRSAESGTALASGVAELAAQCRRDALHAATAAAERAGVLIAAPLGLCFLPAFVCLGIVPVIAGLAGTVLGPGLL
ncbi:type II secretion system F family protein [Mycolicibacillus parakoreensis]|uniref:Type II secretion system F family protein n=1 Tax=Mycolicibacillus parakoreensis TaxID=1069221 RepID=A0ABY3U0T5_9MYCO|nr:type II secretion system F family protein [Mycolicibacillus parakoreensis]MCV7314569.1 type II secretion system F family protein [Mycolicibacillus parakoreensis]ULN53102.1 type II secretion system F family protein [Mycolicibacillus parakoreensis]